MSIKFNRPEKRSIGKIEDRGKEGFTKLGLPRKKLGRPQDESKNLSLEERRKLYLEMHRKGIRLTAEQTAIAMWNPEKEAKPLSKVMICKIERQALAKLRAKLNELGLKSLDDILSPKREEEAESPEAWQ